MRSLLTSPTQQYRAAGFTLLELLVVISLLAILAGLSISAYEGVQDQARLDAAEFEMAEIRDALLQFRRDTNELPCRIYRSGNYNPFTNTMPELDFTGIAGSTAANFQQWCEYQDTSQVNSALTMLQQFPFDALTTTNLVWNPDTKRGWNGPYLSNRPLTDPWGNAYQLLDAELDYPNRFRCEHDGTANQDYRISSNLYSCLNVTNAAITANHTLNADIARLVSAGPDGIFSAENTSDICLPATNSDDFVLCLLR